MWFCDAIVTKVCGFSFESAMKKRISGIEWAKVLACFPLQIERTDPSMYPAERQASIITAAQQGDGSIVVSAMSALLGVTPETVRRDLAALERRGVLSRTHGGARLSTSAPFELALAQRQLGERAERERIARRVIDELPADGVVLLDSGSLILTVAEYLPTDRRLVIVTNNLAAIPVLSTNPMLTVHALPGRVRAMTQGAVDEWTRRRLSELHVDVVILGANGVTGAGGVTTTNPDEAEVKRAMIASARHRVLAVTSSKIGVTSFCTVAALSEFDTVITDSGANPEELDQIRSAGPVVAAV